MSASAWVHIRIGSRAGLLYRGLRIRARVRVTARVRPSIKDRDRVRVRVNVRVIIRVRGSIGLWVLFENG